MLSLLIPLQLNIHRFKVLARFGLMHIVATNICVWIRTLVLESLKEITAYHRRRGPEPEDSAILENIRQHTLRNAGMVMGTELGPSGDTEWEPISVNLNAHEELSSPDATSVLSRIVQGTTTLLMAATTTTTTTSTTTSTAAPPTTTSTTTTTTTVPPPTTSTGTPFADLLTTPSTGAASWTEPTTSTTMRGLLDRLHDFVSTEASSTSDESSFDHFDQFDQHRHAGVDGSLASSTTTTTTTTAGGLLDSLVERVNYLQRNSSLDQTYESLDALFPSAFIATSTSAVGGPASSSLLVAGSNATGSNAVSCGRVNIMGTIVQDSAPYLYPFIIEYSLIGAAVIYVMWKHIGRYPK